MSLFVNSLKLFERGVGVDLRRTDALMTQQVLDTLKPCTVVQHGCGESVAEHVGGAFLQRRDSRQVLMYDDVHLVTRHPFSLITQEQGPSVFSHHLFVADGDEVTQHLRKFLAEGYDTLLIALARHLQLSGVEIHISIIQPRQFRPSQSGLIE